MNKKQSSHCKK